MSGETLDAHVVVRRGVFRLDAAIAADAGEVVALMGPSGAGKSTLLAALAGLVRLAEGEIRVGDRIVDSGARRRMHVQPSARRVVLLSQDARLFPHLTAHENIAFGPRAQGIVASVADAEADEWLWRVGLDGMGRRRPAELSGGQQQRVAIARALATTPAVLLLDEPLTSLDPETGDAVRAVLQEQLASTRTTAIVATHDAVDAVALAHRMVVLEEGVVTQEGAVRDILSSPATGFAAAVAGLNRVTGRVADGRWERGGLSLGLGGQDDELREGAEAAAVFRPGAVRLERVDATTWTGTLRLTAGREAAGEWVARVVRLEQTPAGVRVHTDPPVVAVDLAPDAALGLAPGVPVQLRLAETNVRFLPVVRPASADAPAPES
ncbi:ABC transporter ATP-binding protein [Microbacterium ulmi]|uniref:ABC transporter ATP-binding protein n=1 Tax=Microbacterium ulmi TaxID=179095 RepID=A0A7Y2Q1X4_9MICO|nr:ABC transporter ATP-binding protein [Microbacterium ulmi]NII68642.1 molybdate transport system ATP-binding protein [Microbacterium ulmi]NNH04812.1 ABC transporter ATP-binding protein [Microbacterium ulmi]